MLIFDISVYSYIWKLRDIKTTVSSPRSLLSAPRVLAMKGYLKLHVFFLPPIFCKIPLLPTSTANHAEEKKMLTKSQIEVIHALYMERKLYRCTANIKRIAVHTFQLWIKKICVPQPSPHLTHKKRPGKKMLLSRGP